MRKTAIFKDDLFLRHDPGFQHVESPARLQVIYEQLDRPAINNHFLFPDFLPAPPEILLLNHTAAHIARVAATAGQTFNSLDPDTQTSPRSYDAACLAAGAVVAGVEQLWRGEAENGFALVRPPGHHAEADRAMGFCLFNNVAIGAHYALKNLKAARILIVDWDLHHGNGTQQVFYETNQVLYISIHQYPHYPGTGALLETGTGPGRGFTINIPLPGGQGDPVYGQIFREIVGPVARQYQPELILVSAGFDAFYADPLGSMTVTAAGFGYMTRILVELAEELCGGRLLLALEGGYDLAGLRDGVLAVLAELTGSDDLTTAPVDRVADSELYLPLLAQVRTVVKNYWRL